VQIKVTQIGFTVGWTVICSILFGRSSENYESGEVGNRPVWESGEVGRK
jgi:hypothetical protein